MPQPQTSSPNDMIMAAMAPDAYAQQVQLARRQQMAQMLMQQGMESPQGQMVSGHYVAPAITQHLARLLSAFGAGRMNEENDSQQAQIARMYAESLARAAQGRQPQVETPPGMSASSAGAFGLPPSAATPEQPVQSGGPFSLPSLFQSRAIETLGGNAAAGAFWDRAKLTDLQKNMAAAATDPNMAAWAKKETYIPPVAMRPGGVTAYPDGRMEQMPSAIEGSQAVKNSDGTWAYRPMEGAIPAMTASSQATALGKNAAEPQIAYDANNNPVFTNKAAAAQGGAPGGWIGPEPKGQFVGDPQEIRASIKAIKDPQIRAEAMRAFDNQMSGGQQGVLRPEPSQTNKDLIAQGSDFYKKAINESAQTGQLRSFLKEMEALAADPKNTFGPGTATMARVTALAKNAGIDLTDAQTAQDVMRKLSSNLAMSQLGQGGTGTDAQLETLLHSFPSGEMTNEAIKRVIPMLHQQLDVKESRTNIINHVVSSTGDMSKVPNALVEFNRLADPAAIALGKQLAEASRTGAMDQLRLTKEQKALIPKVRKLDELGAF